MHKSEGKHLFDVLFKYMLQKTQLAVVIGISLCNESCE